MFMTPMAILSGLSTLRQAFGKAYAFKEYMLPPDFLLRGMTWQVLLDVERTQMLGVSNAAH